MFRLDILMQNSEPEYSKIGEQMGLVLLMKVPDLEPEMIVSDTSSIKSIQKAV